MDADTTISPPKPPILFLHGVFGKPSLLRPWTRMLEAEGYAVHAPTMPGREPTDRAVLSRTGIEECCVVALEAYDRIGEPAIVIGHSMGGLLAQKIAAARQPVAAVLLASVPPGVLWLQPRVLPHFLPIMSKVVAGKPFLPSPRTMRDVPLSTLPPEEQDALIPHLVHDSGLVFRQLSMGAAPTRVAASDVTCPVLCVSAGSDENVAPWISRRIARRYRAEQQDHPGKPHWIIAESALPDVAPGVLDWLNRAVRPPTGVRPTRPADTAC